MNPKNYVSLPIAWELKGLGFPQTSEVCWDMFDELAAVPLQEKNSWHADAPTVSELFDALPLPSSGPDVPFLYTGISRTYGDSAEKYFCMVQKWKSFTADTMPDAVGKAIVALVKAKKLRFLDWPTDAEVSELMTNVAKVNKLNRKQQAKKDLQFLQAAANVGFPI